MQNSTLNLLKYDLNTDLAHKSPLLTYSKALKVSLTSQVLTTELIGNLMNTEHFYYATFYLGKPTRLKQACNITVIINIDCFGCWNFW